VVRCDLRQGAAPIVAFQVARGLFSTGGEAGALSQAPSFYPGHHVTGGPKQLEAQVRVKMQTLEVLVSRVARERGEDEEPPLLVADGRLGVRRDLPNTIGCVKSQTGRYLPQHLLGVVTSLPSGHRSPVFGLSSLFSWYVRLPGAPPGPWSGIVRVECSAEIGTQRAVELADRSLVTLPRFAASPYKDARAPQNLTPIAGLERKLRSLLGDPRILHRALLRESRP
jgi:hypothetical protein